MIQLEKVIQEYTHESKEQLKKKMADFGEIVVQTLESKFKGNKKKVFTFTALMLSAASNADGDIDSYEYEYFTETIGMKSLSYDEFVSFMKSADTEVVKNNVDSIIDTIGAQSEAIKDCFVHFLLCYLALNGDIADKELAFIKKIIE